MQIYCTTSVYAPVPISINVHEHFLNFLTVFSILEHLFILFIGKRKKSFNIRFDRFINYTSIQLVNWNGPVYLVHIKLVNKHQQSNILVLSSCCCSEVEPATFASIKRDSSSIYLCANGRTIQVLGYLIMSLTGSCYLFLFHPSTHFQSTRSEVIATYALCGFANLGSIGIMIGALSAMTPGRQRDISSLAFRAMMAGNFACFLTACIAGEMK